MRLKTTFTLACLTVFGVPSVANGADTTHHSHMRKPAARCKRDAKHKGTHHNGCSHSTRRRHSIGSKAPTPTAPAAHPTPTPPSTTPMPELTPTSVCPKNAPLPTPVAGQTTIAGYAWISGGAPGGSSCPGDVSAPATVALETTGGQPLESQRLDAGQPYDFVVQPGEYEIVDTLCVAERLVKAQEGQQTIAETGCNIP